MLTQRRGVADIEKRGRWRAAESVTWYQKAAGALQEFIKMEPALTAYGRWVEAKQENVVHPLLRREEKE